MTHAKTETDCREAAREGSSPLGSIASNTLRPPKRQGEDADSPIRHSPKRPRPTPSPDSISRLPTPSSCHATSSPLHAFTPGTGTGPTHEDQDDLLPMDWAPAAGETIGARQKADGGTDHSHICYGALCEAKARFKSPTQAKQLMTGDGRFCLLSIVRHGMYYALAARSNEVVADLDLATSRALKSLENTAGVTAAAVIGSATVSQCLRDTKASSIVPLSVNVYGPMSSADRVGDVLSAASAFLQHPFFLEPGCKGYFNPQILRFGGNMHDLTHLVGLTEEDLRAKTLSDEVEHILASLDDVPYPAASALSAELELAPVLTSLRDHQLTALRFIRLMEDEQYSQATQKRLRDLANIPARNHIPSYFAGGILADVMGLGKTLTMIAAVVSTLPHSRQCSVDLSADGALSGSGATLVVVTSAQILSVWETEIDKHLRSNYLRACRFHQKSRPRAPRELLDYDLVITTYATLSADFKSRGVLQKVEWYRIVLDEAHWIRNRTSTQYQAAVNLTSTRRWCLTGTPIQNSLNDLISLLSFLHFEPFSSQAIFQRHIIAPLAKGPRSAPGSNPRNAASSLRELLRAVCLRRDERLLGLPPPRSEEVKVRLHEDERARYNEIMAKCARDIDDAVSSRAKIKKYSILFTAMMKLRRACNHGTFGTASIPGGTNIDAGSVEQGCDFCSGTDEDRLELVLQGDICSECGRQLPSRRSFTRGSGEASLKISAPSSQGFPSDPSSNPILQGVSSKIQAVVDRLRQTEHGSKSLVFSSWVATLDLLEQRLRAHGVNCLRIDGSVTYSARLQILDEFRETDVPVLLMTVQTGAVGLNLTAANYVHIVEPQWNPSVEEQAIARAVRMGQTRTVTVIRYVVKNSVEENIVHLQKRKRSLAKFTLDGASQDGASGTLDDLRFVLNLDLFR